MTKKLGLDLGSSSIGWAVINYVDNPDEIKVLGVGSRVLPIDSDSLSEFTSGNQISINANRTTMRTLRKSVDRYILRREALTDFFRNKGIEISEALMTLNRDDLWRLRAKAATEPVSPEELARVLYLINQKRGYKASKADLDPENKETAGYVSEVRNRYTMLREAGMTVGQWGSSHLAADPEYRIKQQVFPRAAYIEEFDKIIETQRRHNPELLTDEDVRTLRNRIIFYQRPLKSCKHLVSPCEFEQFTTTDREGREIKAGPKVTHRSNPLFQLFRIWESVNHITLTDRMNEKSGITLEQKKLLVSFLLNNDKLKATDFNKIIFGKGRQTLYSLDELTAKGIPGDKTRMTLKKILGDKYPGLLELNLTMTTTVDKSTGEELPVLSPEVAQSPIYRLWHCIYSIPDKESLAATLRSQFGIDDESILEALSNIDFGKEGYANLSVKAIRRIMPFLMEGKNYADASAAAGIRHSHYLTKEENLERELADAVTPLSKGELRQPIVEKILNQMVNLVNALINRYGKMDEIVVELARDLQQSREERNVSNKRKQDNEKENRRVAELIQEYGLYPTRSRIVKYRLWEEAQKQCIYCGANVGIKEFLIGYDAEVEHIIPKSLLFDDSYSNKACSCRKCNQEKGNSTARDFMMAKGEKLFNEYVDRLHQLKAGGKISKTKFENLMRSSDDLPKDFIERQLRESQYISRKAMEMLREVCHNVRATSGSVTDYLRHVWGWDQVLHSLNLDARRLEGSTEIVELEHRGSTETTERITGWSKRLDHRHHAIDALTIACTTQGIVQQLNNLSSLAGKSWRDFHNLPDSQKQRHTQLERYALHMPHFTAQQVTAEMERLLVSFKPVTKLTVPGKRYVQRHGKRDKAQTGILVPRGSLHKETIYGQINVPDNKGGFRKEYVVKYKLSAIKSVKEANSIVDKAIRQLVIDRLNQFNGNAKQAFSTPLYSDKAQTKEIKSVRCFTGITKAIPLRRDKDGSPTGFAVPGGNHHVALYEDADGNLQEHVATFFHCVERKRFGLPAIIADPAAVWDDIFARRDDLPEAFLEQLPKPGWKLRLTLQRNEMFVIGMSDEDFSHAIATGDKKAINECLYRVQKLSSLYYVFTRHTETDISQIDKLANKPGKRFLRFRSIPAFQNSNPKKIRINNMGEIEEVC